MTVATVPAPPVFPPRMGVPEGACDAHTHVFGPHDRFPPAAPSVYALPDATPEVHAGMRARLGVARAVLVQPAPYGTDPAAMLSALRGAGGALRGVAVADGTVTDSALETWHGAGVRGLRFVEMRAPGGGRYPGSVGLDALRDLAPRMRDLGWHAALWAAGADMADLLPRATGFGVPVVLDHMGMPDTAAGVDAPGFAAVREAVREGRAWVKLTLARVAGDARPFHEALVAANPDFLLWGSDWPYVRMDPAPDAGAMLDRFGEWVGDEGLRRRVLSDNPARLYGFGERA